jgi:hypothetical protein
MGQRQRKSVIFYTAPLLARSMGFGRKTVGNIPEWNRRPPGAKFYGEISDSRERPVQRFGDERRQSRLRQPVWEKDVDCKLCFDDFSQFRMPRRMGP